MHRLISIAILILVATALQSTSVAGGEAASPDVPKVTATKPLVDLAKSVQNVTDENHRAGLTLLKALPPDKSAKAALNLTISRVRGSFTSGKGSSPKWNRGRHVIEDAEGLKVKDGRMKGEVRVTLKPDRWVPKDKQPIPITVQIDAAVTRIDATPDEKSRAQEGTWWRIFPKAQGAVLKVAGTYTLTNGKSKEVVKGEVGGYLSLPIATGAWNMGKADGDGVAFHFAMGEKRQNWNHARLSQLQFEGGARDLSASHGLRVRVKTAKPRIDAGVTVWLREEDGSWYYVKDGIPLSSEQNEAVLLWEDFEEAEWVAPTNHMDEDYVLDVKRISHIAIGVVNPLGVGDVGFTLNGLELVTCDRPAQQPAVVDVSGQLLSVNDFDVVPAPLMGGYAGNLPAKYRPGCQRTLRFTLSPHPSVPRQNAARLHGGNIKDGQALIAAIAEQGKADAPSPGKRIWSLLDEKTKKRRFPGWLKKAPTKPKDLDRRKRDIGNALNRLLGKADLYDAASWEKAELSDALKARAAKAASSGLNATEILELNRDLLAAAFPNLIIPRPTYGPTEQYIIDCQGERFQPATYLVNPNWERDLENLGKAYGENARKAGQRAVMEFWNEPYLNWAERSRINYNVKFYRTDLAKEGGEVSVKRPDGKLDVVPHLKWVKARPGKISKTKNGLMVIDETAFSYWSGRANGYMYDKMYNAIARGIKSTNPDVICVAGWGFRWHEDHWAAWDLIYKPTIDYSIKFIDGIHEHHYQGDTTDMVGSYEVLTAYGMTAHKKWLRSYNTECNDLVDAPSRGAVDTPEKVGATKNYRRCIYNLRDILYCIHETPDKAAARTMIHWSQAPQGTEVCFNMLLNLRGRLVEARSDDAKVWCVSSIDGTDPAAMPPEPGQTLVVIVFNEHRTPREVKIAVAPPPGTTFESARTERIERDPKTFAVRLVGEDAKAEAKSYAAIVTLPERSAWKVSLRLKGKAPSESGVARKQFFSKHILQPVQPEKSLATAVKLEPKMLAAAKRAWLRVVVENVSPGEAIVEVGKTRLVLPKAFTRDNGNSIMNLPLDPKALTEDNAIRFSVAKGNHAGYRVDMASIVLETRR